MQRAGDLFGNRGATFSPCKLYRYRLWRYWTGGNGLLNFLMLNPSTADEMVNDATVERCQRRAEAMGFAGLVVTNLFAFRTTFPSEMEAAADPVGPDNDAAILAAAREARMVICAWGEHGSHRGRAGHVRQLLAGIKLHALRLNAGGQPAHPLYLPSSLEPAPFGP